MLPLKVCHDLLNANVNEKQHKHTFYGLIFPGMHHQMAVNTHIKAHSGFPGFLLQEDEWNKAVNKNNAKNTTQHKILLK